VEGGCSSGTGEDLPLLSARRRELDMGGAGKRSL
jgi:hypothetical protein